MQLFMRAAFCAAARIARHLRIYATILVDCGKHFGGIDRTLTDAPDEPPLHGGAGQGTDRPMGVGAPEFGPRTRG